MPLTSFLVQPNGLLEKAVNALCSGVAFVGSAGSSKSVSQTSKVAALSTLYIAMTYAISGANSVAGVASAQKEGRDNKYPRAQLQGLSGLPLRLHSAHYNMMEKFPGFALSGALAQTMAPGDQSLINLLALHVISKIFVYVHSSIDIPIDLELKPTRYRHYPAYLLNLDTPRSVAHIIATASVINVALKLSKRT